MESAPINKVQDKNGNQFFPITHQQAVINDDGDDLVTELGKKLSLSGGTMTGAITPATGQGSTPCKCSTLEASESASLKGITAIGTTSSATLQMLRAGVNYIWASTAGGWLLFGVQDKGAQSAANATLTVDAYGIGVGPNIYATAAVALNVNGNVAATGTITPGSDARIKDKQQDILPEEAMGIIARLKPKTWEWNALTDNAGKKAAGLVAQEVAEVVPEAVVIGKSLGFEDFHSLNYNAIQGYEIAAIKGLIEEVNALRKELAELKKTK